MSDNLIPSRLSYEKIIEDALADFLGLATNLAAYPGSGDSLTVTPRLDVVVDNIDQRFNIDGQPVPIETPRGDEYLQQTAAVSIAVVVKIDEQHDRNFLLDRVGEVRAAMLKNSGNFIEGVFPGLSLVDVKPNGSSRETSDGKHTAELSYLIDFDTDPADWPE